MQMPIRLVKQFPLTIIDRQPYGIVSKQYTHLKSGSHEQSEDFLVQPCTEQ